VNQRHVRWLVGRLFTRRPNWRDRQQQKTPHRDRSNSFGDGDYVSRLEVESSRMVARSCRLSPRPVLFLCSPIRTVPPPRPFNLTLQPRERPSDQPASSGWVHQTLVYAFSKSPLGIIYQSADSVTMESLSFRSRKVLVRKDSVSSIQANSETSKSVYLVDVLSLNRAKTGFEQMFHKRSTVPNVRYLGAQVGSEFS
jgi:hypothetical protein